MPETFWDAEKGAVKGDDFARHLEETTARLAEVEARKAAAPKEAKEYKLELPEDVTLPEGVALNPDDPRLAAAQELAHKLGMSQGEFSQLVALDVQARAAEAQALAQFRSQSMEKLGPQATERVGAVEGQLKARFGDDAGHLVAMLVSDKQVVLFEKLLRGEGSAQPFNANGSQPATDPGKVEGYDNMNFRQRMAAADAAKQARGR